MKALFAVAALFTCLAVPAQAVTVIGNDPPRAVTPQQMEQALRQMAFIGNDDSPFDLSAILDNGRPTLITLWAHWCAVCQAEMVGFRELARKCGDALNVVFVSSRVSDYAADLKKFLSYDLTWQIVGVARSMLADASSYAVYRAFSGITRDGSVVTPMHYFVAANGKLDTILFTPVDFSTPESVAMACGR